MSEALRLATAPGAVIPVDIETTSMLAAELRRLHALNQELLEALQGLLGMPDYDGTAETSRLRLNHKHAAWAAIAKAEETK